MLGLSLVNSLISSLKSSVAKWVIAGIILTFSLGATWAEVRTLSAQVQANKEAIQEIRDLDLKTNLNWIKESLERIERKLDERR